MARIPAVSKKRLVARNIFWAFDADRSARRYLDQAADKQTSPEDRDIAMERYLVHERMREEAIRAATGMGWQEYHNFAFKADGKLAA